MKIPGIVFIYLLLACACLAQDVFSVKRCGTLSPPRERHGSFFYKERLYVMGGKTPTDWTNSVQSASVGANGMLGPWRHETPLPDRRNYLNGPVQVVGNHVYVIGGNVSDMPDPATKLHKASHSIWTTIQPDGTLAAWSKGPDFLNEIKGGLVCLSAIADENHILITGGTAAKGLIKDVFICDLAADGTPGAWRVLGPLPVPLYYNGTALIGGRIYLYGGLNKKERSSINALVYSAAYNGTTLSEWRQEPSDMPSPIYSSVFCSTPRCLLAIGGRYANDYGTKAIWYAPLVNGVVQKWQMVKTDLPANVYITGAVDIATGRCFVSGGQLQTVPKENAPAEDAVSAFVLPGQ